ncbi:MAG: hypothetical protein PUF79_00145 [Lactobacillaceae bacterium]|nr:hypothetical protein [Lactobacillaceae bacterium]
MMFKIDGNNLKWVDQVVPVRPKENLKLLFKFIESSVNGEDLAIGGVQKRLVRVIWIWLEVIDVAQIFF